MLRNKKLNVVVTKLFNRGKKLSYLSERALWPK